MLSPEQFWPDYAAASERPSHDETAGASARLRESILPETAQLLDRLPIEAYPYWTLRRYPHTLNAIARRCKDPADIVRAIDGLLHCDRPGRQGFPVEVFLELLEIAHCHGSRADSRPPPTGFFGYNVRFSGEDVLMRAAFARSGRMPRRAPPCRARDLREMRALAPNQPARARPQD